MSFDRENPGFAVRLVCAEFYQTSPILSLDPVYSEFRAAEVKYVPVIRIFGSTASGEKTCLHVHGVFPYLYVPYTGGDNRDRFGYHLATSLDAAINVSLGSAAARNQHVFKVQLISGMPLYGYHEKEHQYFKVYFYNPAMVKRAANLLQNGAVFNENLQPHEAHIPYVQQFMIDYNLHGMNMIELRRVRHRSPARTGSATCSHDAEIRSLIADNSEYLPSEIVRQSICQLEVDALATDILNRQEIERELVLNPGLAAIWEEERARRRQLDLDGGDSQLVHPNSPARTVLKPTENDIYQRRRLAKRLSTISQNDETAISTRTEKSQSSYPLETEDNSNLITASSLEHHIGPQSGTTGGELPKRLNELVIDHRLDLSSRTLPLPTQNPSQSLNYSMLDAADISVLNILNGLVDDNADGSTVDEDSLFGSQCIDSETRSSHDGHDDESDDMNLTLLQLDSLSWSQREEGSQRLGDQDEPDKKTTAYDYLRDLSVFDLDTDDNSDDGMISGEYTIPQYDGAGDSLSPAANKLSKKRAEFPSLNFNGTPCTMTTSCETPKFALGTRYIAECDRRHMRVMPEIDRKNTQTVDDRCVSLTSMLRSSASGKRSLPTRKIPALDGPVDLSSEDSDLESDVTLDSYEQRICDYRSDALSDRAWVEKRNCREKVACAVLGSPMKNGKPIPLSKDVHQSTKGLSSLNGSSGRPPRSYSPLSIIVESPKKVPERVREISPNETITIERQCDETEHCSNDRDICNVTFVQHLNAQLKENARSTSRYEHIDNSRERISRKIVIGPKLNPPDFNRVTETMEAHGIPLCRYDDPYFGNHMDVTNHKEVAHKLVRVPSRCLIHLPQFKTDLEIITGIARWRMTKVKDVYPACVNIEISKMRQRLTSQNKTAIVPSIIAPSPKTVKAWSRAKEYLNKRGAIDAAIDNEGETSTNRFAALSICNGQYQPRERIISVSHGNNSQSGKNTNVDSIDPTLENALRNPNLYTEVDSSRQLGVSCGQIESSSQANHFKIPCQNLQDIKPLTTYQYLTILCLELHIVTRGDLLPDPQHDAIRAIFYAVHNDVPAESNLKSLDYGVLAYGPTFDTAKSLGYLKGSSVTCPVSYTASEEDLFEHFLRLINELDPDILVGWELESLSWGYLFQRAANIGIDLAPRVSRIPCTQRAWEIQTTELNILTEIKMPGRIVLDIWRIMKHEIALQSYTFENVMYHVMHQRVNCPSFAMLTRWWEHQAARTRSIVVEHYVAKVVGILKIIDQLDIIGKTTELARLYGIQFFEVFSRGSQFQVESVMLRLAKPSNYVPVSPSVLQRATMRAPESLPLIMEPESAFYSDPLIVLDFQSLYPSIIIAHNYCFSTCLGRVENIGQSVPFEFGATSLKVTRRTALRLGDKLNFSPCGVAFVDPGVRVGILPRMLTEYLDTRLMVKKAMKDHSQTAHALQRALHSRQRGLKLLANVTFGYTHANFSGRMPCIEIGDSIVSKARETLERAIKLVESTKRWNARVVYGDTDSLFVLLRGRSRERAFEVGAEIANAVTADNPKPIKLKLEKIMQPAILQTKKRYCGYMFESPDQEKPVYLAKGIETVRRDGCPAVSKILEKSLRILFDTKDVSRVKMYVTRQLDKVLRGQVSIQDLIFAKEFRGLQGYKSSACVPALELVRRLILKDPRAIPRTSERVPYIIVAGAPNQPLFQCVRSPWELIADTGLRPNVLYYTTRVIIPPLNRCFNLLGVNVNAWFEEMPHRQAINFNPGVKLGGGKPQKSTISQYFATVACATCGHMSNAGICGECSMLPSQTIVILHEKIRQMERSSCSIAAICQSCTGRVGYIECASLDCPVLYRRIQSVRNQHQISHMRRIIDKGNSLEL